MSHVVHHCAQFATEAQAITVEQELLAFRAACAAWERRCHESRTNMMGLVPEPLAALATKHAFALPAEGYEILLKGLIDDVMQVRRMGSLIVFYGGGFDLGGAAIESYFAAMGATAYDRNGAVLVVECDAPDEAATDLAAALDDEEYDEQYTIGPDEEGGVFTIRFEGGGARACVAFDDSGVQDWAFIASLSHLTALTAPRLVAPPPKK
jgi:hypothetical protein